MEQRVLVVENHEATRHGLMEQLSTWGMRCASVATGGEALEALHVAEKEGDPFQVVLLDQHLPDIDGQTLGRMLKADPLLQQTRWVRLSAARPEALAEHPSDYAACLTKPVQPGRLLQVLTHERRGNSKDMTKKNGDPRNTTETRAIDLLAEARVLVVENDPINLKVILRMLAQMGCRADAAIDGKAALEKIEQGAYDLVLMNCQMPELDGYETTRTIRRREGAGMHLPIVALTAHALQGDRKKCLEAGMDDYISKPMGPKDLKTALLRWLPGPAEQQPPPGS